VQALVTDGVLSGENINRIVRPTGLGRVLPVSPQRASTRPATRVEKEAKLRDVIFANADGVRETVEIWTRGGHLCRRVYLADGTSLLEHLGRTETRIRENLDGTYRSYVCYSVPNPFDGAPRIISESTLTDPKKDGTFNRSENVRQIPPHDPYGERLKVPRQDAESINRGIDDQLPLGRARGWNDRSQLLDLIGPARAVNSLTRYRYGATKRGTAVAA
jgi:hypothetical protein